MKQGQSIKFKLFLVVAFASTCWRIHAQDTQIQYLITAMKWEGQGPYRVWKNRLEVGKFGVWQKCNGSAKSEKHSVKLYSAKRNAVV